MAHVLLRAASVYFVVMLVIMAPAAGWNTPGADYSRSDCCFASHSWDDKPCSSCTFTAKVDAAWDWQMKEWRSYDNPDAHVYLLQNGIRILQEKGYDNWAAYLADENNFQALADGATWADAYKGRWWVNVYVTALLGTIEIPVYKTDPTCAAGWDHYYNSFLTDPLGKGLECLDVSVITQYFLDAFAPILSAGVINGSLTALQFLPTVGFVFQGIKVLQDVGMLGVRIIISPAIRESYPSAGKLSQEHFDSAVNAYTATYDMTHRYWEHRSAQYDSLFQAGWAAHLAQDVCVIYHQRDVWDTFEYYHAAFEDQATSLGDPDTYPAYHVHAKDWTVAANYDSLTVAQICREGALATSNPQLWEKAKSDDPMVRDVALRQGLKVADQVTAALLAKYLTNLGIPKYVPTFKGAVYDATTGKPVEGAYVFYREKLGYTGDPDAAGGIQTFIDQQRPWDYTTTDLKGTFALTLQEGRTYLIRAEFPGYSYAGYIDVSTQEPMGQTITPKTVEFTQAYAGGALSDISYFVYLSPVGSGGLLQAMFASPSPLFYSYAGPDPALPLSTAISPALRRDLADAVMAVRADTTVLASKASGAAYPLQIPAETYIEIEVANLLNVGTAKTLQSPQQIETALAATGTTWATYHDIVRNPAAFQAFNPVLSPDVPATVSPGQVQPPDTATETIRWQFSVSPDFAISSETLRLDPLADKTQASVDTGYSPAAIAALIQTAPREQVMLSDGNVTDVPVLSYSFGGGNMVHGEGQPLSEYHLGRVPAANAKIKVTLVSEPGCIGPDFTVIPATTAQIQYDGGTKPTSLAGQNKMQQAFATPAPVSQSTDSTIEVLTLLTNAEGVAALTLKSGSQAGKIKLFVEIIENPGATGIKPHQVVEVVVHPPIMQVDAAPVIVPPSLGVVAPRQPLVATYLASYNGEDVTVVDTGMGLQVTEAGDGTLVMSMVETGPATVASTSMAVEAAAPETSSPFGWLSGIIDGILAIPGQITGIFSSGEKQGSGPADGTPCDDGNACTVEDVYDGGACRGGPFLNCDDGNPTTEDWCDPAVGCRHEDMSGGAPADRMPCDDGNACTVNDFTEGDVCMGGEPLNCDDGNPTTEDWCDPEIGCLHEDMSGGAPADRTPCDDGNACTVNDFTEGDVCMGGEPLNCDDGNPSTEDWCDPEIGCLHEDMSGGTRDGTRCDDGNACTVNDVVMGGVCEGGEPVDCDDGNPSTEDWCDPEIGCRHEDMSGGTRDGTRCDDGNACTVNDVVIGGVCEGGELVDCNDGNPSTEDWCDPEIGCRHTAIEDVCPRGCECLTEAEADAKFMNFVLCLDNPCGYFTPARGEPVPKYCYRSAE